MRFQTANLQLDLLDTYFSMVVAKGLEQPEKNSLKFALGNNCVATLTVIIITSEGVHILIKLIRGKSKIEKRILTQSV